MPNLALHTAIEELLLRDQFACIPQLGGFLLKASDSTVNAYTKELKPTHSQLVFNAKLSENDGQLAHLLSVASGISYKEALAQIEISVAELKSQLNQKRYATFFPFGNFFHNEHKGIFFVARQQFNLHLPNYGLQPVKWEQNIAKSQALKTAKVLPIGSNLSPSKIEEATVMAVSEEHADSVASKHQSNTWWQIAAGFVVISISALTLTIATMTWLEAYQERQQYASMMPVQGTEIRNNKDVSATDIHKKDGNSAAEFIYVNGKLIQISSNTASSSRNTNESTSKTPPTHSVLEENSIETSSVANIPSSEEYLTQLLNQQGTIFIVGGSYMTANAAQIECQQWIKLGTPATIFKPKNASFYRIVLGRFKSKQDAQDYSVTMKTIPQASLSMVRWDIK